MIVGFGLLNDKVNKLTSIAADFGATPPPECLRLFTHPELLPRSNYALKDDELREMKVKEQIQELATKTFAKLHTSCPKLSAFVLNPREKWDDCDVYGLPRSFGYLRLLQTDLFGRTTAAASAIEPHIVKYYEPGYEILEDKERLDIS